MAHALKSRASLFHTGMRGEIFHPRNENLSRNKFALSTVGYNIGAFVFSWLAASKDTAVRAFSRHGYHIRCRQRAGVDYWAISDINDHDLDEFVRLFQEQTQEVRH